MGLINFTEAQDGNTAQASDLNSPLNTIYDEFNGNIDTVNLSDDAVTTAKLADDSVTPEKRSGGFHVDTLTVTSGTGTQAVTGLGFQPKAIIFFDSPNDSNSNLTGFYGIATPTTQQVSAFGVSDGELPKRYGTSAAVYVLSTGATVEIIAEVDSFDSDGFTLNKTTANSNRPVMYMAFA